MIDSVLSQVSRFLTWWGRELSAMVPGFLRPSAGLRGTRTVIAADKSTVQLIEERSRGSRILATAEVAGDDARQDPLSVFDPIEIRGILGLRVPFDACFSRSLRIPVAAVADAAALAAIDLERTTPFRSADVLTAVFVEQNGEPMHGTVALRQLVLKRATIQPLRASLARRGLEAAFIDCWTADRTSALPVDFLAVDRPAQKFTPRPRRLLNQALAVAVVLGLVTTFGLLLVKHANALAVLDLETRAARQAAAGVGDRIVRAEAAMADVARLRDIKARRPLIVGLLDDVTRLLPDGVYLTEFNLDGDQLDIAGYAVSAAPLLELFERSRKFKDARFAAPFRFDQREERERFSMRVRVVGAQSAVLEDDRK